VPTIECSTACTVAVTLSLSPPTMEEVADLGAAFLLIMGVTVVIYGCRQVLNIFKADHES
jgi:hypothetical protein